MFPVAVFSADETFALVRDGAAGFCHVGADAPLDVNTCPAVPADPIAVIADVPFPNRTLFAVSVPTPVPPLATESVPVFISAAE